MDVREPVTKEEVEEKYVLHAARSIAYKYSLWGVTVDDCQQEILEWYYSDRGQKNIARWLANDPQQTSRIRYTFLDTARRYAEREKAEKVGYDPDDIHWYSASQVEALMPLVLDQTFDGTGVLDYDASEKKSGGGRSNRSGKRDPAENNDLLAMVVDVRRAVSSLPEWVGDALYNYEAGRPVHVSAIEAVVQYLGGPRPFTGRRPVKSNSQAQAETKSTYEN